MSSPAPLYSPMRLGRRSKPFSHADWLFEVKYDGFRSLLHASQGKVRLVSRNMNEFRSFAPLCDALERELRGRDVVLDGEIVCVDTEGRCRFDELFWRKGEARLFAFDCLRLNGTDLRYLPLYERKQALRSSLPRRSAHILYCDHIEEHGEALFQLACERDLEGIVGKWKYGPYLSGSQESTWLKVKNRAYTQMAGRDELFDRFREPSEEWPQFRCYAAV